RPGERRPGAEGHAPVAGPHLVDANRERSTAPRAPHLDRPAESVPLVERPRTPVLDLAVGLPAPAGVQHAKAHRVAGVDRQRRREAAREVTLRRPALERELVDHGTRHARPGYSTTNPSSSKVRS